MDKKVLKENKEPFIFTFPSKVNIQTKIPRETTNFLCVVEINNVNICLNGMQRKFKTIFCVFHQYAFFIWIALLWRLHAFNNMSRKPTLEFGVEKGYINYLFVFVWCTHVPTTWFIKESLQSFTLTSSLETICANIDFSNSIITSRYKCQKVLWYEVKVHKEWYIYYWL